jgi:ribose transport system substrate-binding protein
MGKLIKLKRKKKKGFAAPAGYRTKRPAVRSAGEGSMRRTRRLSGIKALLRRYYKVIAVAGGVLVVAVLCLVLLLGGKNTAATGQTAQTTPSLPPAEETYTEETYDYTTVDAATLAGLAGTDESLFSDDEELADALFAEEGIRIGVTVGSIDSSDQELILNRLEQVSNTAEADKTIYKTYYNNANGDYNQQLQDVRSLIKNGADVIIVGFTNEESFKMITMMAENEGIPVVAFDAPVDSGYAINVVADQSAWGSVYGKFAADKLAAGNVVQVLGKQDSPIDTERAAAIAAALAANVNLTMADPIYAEWDETKAKEAMAAYLDGGTADAVITEEGMAEGILDAFVAKGVLPKVMCGDATAGFIKKWYALKNGGIDVTPPAEDDGKKKNDDETPTPTPAPVMFTAQPGEFITCAQPAPSGIGAAAFDIALEMAKGRTLKTEGQTFKYTVSTLITDTNLAEYYEQVKDLDDSYIVCDRLTSDVLDSLLNPLDEGETPAETPAATPEAQTTPSSTTVGEE